MGTSGSYGGPGPGDTLLPPDAPRPEPAEGDEEPHQSDTEDEPQDDEQDDEGKEPETNPPPSTWAATKRAMSRYSRGTGKNPSRDLRQGVRGFVRNQGGGSGASAASRTGKNAARALGRFAADVARRGVTDAASVLGLTQYLEQPGHVLVAALVEKLSPEAGHVDDDVARRAMAETLAQVLEEEDDAAAPLSSLESLNEDGARELLTRFVVEYIDQRLVHTLGRSIERGATSEAEALDQEKEIRDFVERRVEGVTYDQDVLGIDWDGSEGTDLIEAIFREAYELLEAE